MKTGRNRRDIRQVQTVESLQQFKALYFPTMTASEKKKSDNEEDDNYGSSIAMSILDGIKRDLSALRE